MRALVGAGFALLAAVSAPAARADVTIGSLHGTTALAVEVLGASGTTVAPSGATAPITGVITEWRVRTGAAPTAVRLRVLRPSAGVEVARSDAKPEPKANDTTAYEAHVPVAMGDQIALDCCAGSGGSFFASGVTQTSAFYEPIGDGQPISTPTERPVGTALSADIELDADSDRFGDETQDACPAEAGVAPDGCPASPPPPPPPPPPPATARVNTPPTVRFRTPLAGTAVRASQAIELEVSDDAGNPSVTLFDDDGTICTLSGPPYTCTWTPTGADVGRATLLASAVDSDNRSTLGIVRVKVSRFKANLTARRKGRTVSGRLVLPKAVERSLGCAGNVTVRRGKVRRTTKLKRNCTYSVRLPRSSGSGKLRARFAGNPVVEPAT